MVRRKGGNIDGYSALLSVVPELQLGVVILWNGGADELGTSDLLYSTLIPAFKTALASIQPAPPQPKDPKVFIGTYANTENGIKAAITQVTDKTGSNLLYLNIPNFLGVYLVWKIPSSANSLQLYYPDGILSCLSGDFQALLDEPVEFVIDRNSGLAKSFIIPGFLPGVEFVRQ